jgi:hypothetical protein
MKIQRTTISGPDSDIFNCMPAAFRLCGPRISRILANYNIKTTNHTSTTTQDMECSQTDERQPGNRFSWNVQDPT